MDGKGIRAAAKNGLKQGILERYRRDIGLQERCKERLERSKK
jgi:hypothetical protein